MKDYIKQLFENAGVSLPNENSLGEKIVPDDDPVKLANFWNWFGDSKVVDEQGRPMVVYHGTQAEFNSFRPAKRGIYFASLKRKEEVAGYYAQDKGKILACYLKMENPFIGNPSEVYEMKEKKEKNEKINCDGLISIKDFKSTNKFYNYQTDKLDEVTLEIGDIVEIVVFEPTQIKSIQNNGNFSFNSQNIYESIEYAEMLDDGNMFEVHKNPSDKEFWDLLNRSSFKCLRGIILERENEELLYVWDASNAIHRFALDKFIGKTNYYEEDFATLICRKDGYDFFGICPKWFSKKYYGHLIKQHNEEERKKLDDLFNELLADDDLGLLS